MNAATTPHPPAGNHRGSVLAVLIICIGLAILVIALSFKIHSLSKQVAQAPAPPAQAAPAKPDTAAPAELEKARGAAAQLQAQLDAAKGRQADLKSQLAKAAAQAADLQAQVDEAKAKSKDLQADVDAAKARSAALEDQLAGSASKAAGLQAQLDQEKARSGDLEARLRKAEGEITALQPLVQRARRMPVTTAVERDQGGLVSWSGAHASWTLHITNPFPGALPVAIAISGAGSARSVTGTIAGGATLTIEKLAAGQTVVIASEGYDPVTVAIQ